MAADEASAYGTDNRVMPGIMAGHATDDSAFNTACRIGGAGRAEREQRRQKKSGLTI